MSHHSEPQIQVGRNASIIVFNLRHVYTLLINKIFHLRNMLFHVSIKGSKMIIVVIGGQRVNAQLIIIQIHQ